MYFLKDPLVALLFLTSLSAAQSIAEILVDYEMVTKYEVQSTDSNFSGVAFDPNTGTLLVVDNNSCNIHELTTSGQHVNSIKLNGFNDVEGIAFQADNYFLVCEERNGNVIRINLPQSRSGSINKNDCQVLFILKDNSNSGIEDVTYMSSRKICFAVKEKRPTAIFRLLFDNTGKPVEYQEISTFSWSGLEGDAAGIYALEDGNILILNEIGKKIIGMDSTGRVLSEIIIDMNQPEGITCNEDDGTIYVIGEKRELATFSLKKERIRKRAGESVRVFSNTGTGIILSNKKAFGKSISPNKICYTLNGKYIESGMNYSGLHCASQLMVYKIVNSYARKTSDDTPNHLQQ